ncbi:hypothetical protein BST61_g4324 [Cercospora zeina]
MRIRPTNTISHSRYTFQLKYSPMMAASGGTNTPAPTSRPVDIRVDGAASDLRKRVAVPRISNMLQKSESKSTWSVLSLLENSTADDTSEFEQYQGPPIGYSSAEIVHEDGYKEIVGKLFAPRPYFGSVKCSRKVCGHCYREPIEPESESVVDGKFAGLPPWTHNPEPVTPTSFYPLQRFNWARFPSGPSLLSGLAPRPPPQTPQSHHHGQSNSLSATAPTFIPSSFSTSTPNTPNTPKTSYLKAQLLAREAAAKAVIAAAAAKTNNNVVISTPPTPSSSSSSKNPNFSSSTHPNFPPTGPSNSTYGSRFNHSTGSVFGPRTIDLRTSAQRLNDRRMRARGVVSGAPTAPAAMREAAAAAAANAANVGSSPSLSVDGAGGGEREAWPRLGADADATTEAGSGNGNGKKLRSRKYKEKLQLKAKNQQEGNGNGNGNVTFGTGRQEFWMR